MMPPEGNVAIVSVHVPVPAVRGVGDGVHASPRPPSVTRTVPVGTVAPDVGFTVTLTVIGFPTKATPDGRFWPPMVELAIKVVIVAV